MNQQPLASTGSTLGQTDFGKFGVVVPESLKFQPSRRGLSARRVPVKIRSENQTYASNNNKLVRFMLPNNAIYDTRAGYLTFTLALTTTGGTYKRIHSGIFSIFQRLRILAASTEIEDLRDYNRIYCALWEMVNPIEVTSNIGVTTLGFGSQLQRNALGAAVSTDYACPLFSGVLNTELLPFDNINAGVILELYLDDAVNVVETDGTVPVITISNPVLHLERLDLEPSYRASLASYVSANGLKIGFRTWDRFINSLTTGSQQNLTINTRNSSMNGILNFLINSSQLQNTLINDKFITWVPTPTAGGTLQQTVLQINGTIFPDEPIDCVNYSRYECYQMYCRWVMKWKMNGFLAIAPPINSNAYQSSRFVQIDDLEAYPEEGDLVNPFTTLSNNNTLIKKLQFSAAIPSGWQLDSWVEYFKEIIIAQNGSVSVLQ